MECTNDHLNKFSDARGELIVFLQQKDLAKEQQHFGQIYFVTFNKKGIVRGNHYHKRWTEWFGIVEGKLEVVLEDVSTKERKSFVFDSEDDKYVRLRIGPNIAHAFKSLSDYAALLNYADSEWSTEDAIRYNLL